MCVWCRREDDLVTRAEGRPGFRYLGLSRVPCVRKGVHHGTRDLIWNRSDPYRPSLPEWGPSGVGVPRRPNLPVGLYLALRGSRTVLGVPEGCRRTGLTETFLILSLSSNRTD